MNQLKIYDIQPVNYHPKGYTEPSYTEATSTNFHLPPIHDVRTSNFTTVDIADYKNDLNELFKKVNPKRYEKLNTNKFRSTFNLVRPVKKTKIHVHIKPRPPGHLIKTIKPINLEKSASLTYLQEFLQQYKSNPIQNKF